MSERELLPNETDYEQSAGCNVAMLQSDEATIRKHGLKLQLNV